MKKTIVSLLMFVIALVSLAPFARAAATVDMQITATPDAIVAGGVVDLSVNIYVGAGLSGDSISEIALYLEGGDTPIATWSRIAAGKSAQATVANLFIPVTQLGKPFPVVLRYKDYDGSDKELSGSFLVLEGQPAGPTEARLVFLRSASARNTTIGNTVNFTYSVRNDGLIDITDIEISDEIVGTVATIPRLAPGQREEYIVPIKAMQDLLSVPVVTYVNSATGQHASATVEALSVPISNPKLTVTLKADVTMIKSGETVTLSCTVFNEGNVAFNDVQISEELLGMLPGTSALEPGQSYVCTKKIVPVNSADYVFKVTAKDENGTAFSLQSNTVGIVVEDAPAENAVPLNTLTLSASPDIAALEEPGVVKFTITVGNKGDKALTELTLSEIGEGVLEKMDTMPVGDKVFLYTVQLDADREFTFTVEAKTADGLRVQANAANIAVSVRAADKPLPSNVESTPAVETAEPDAPVTEEPSAPGTSSVNNLLVALMIVIALIAICVITLIVLYLRSRSHSAAAYEEHYDYEPYAQNEQTYSEPAPFKQDDDQEMTRPVNARRRSNAREDERTRPVNPRHKR